MCRFLVAIFILSLGIRVVMFYALYPAERHGSAGAYGSVAASLYLGDGLTTNDTEAGKIESLPNNHTGNYLEFHTDAPRDVFTEFLPGPPVLLALLWKIIPVYNFAPYILLQCVIDAGLIALFFFVFARSDRVLAFAVTGILILNVAAIKRTLMAGYDFWPQFAVLVTFIGILKILEEPDRLWRYFLVGLLTSLTFWFRDLTTFLPFAIAPLVFVYLRKVHTIPTGRTFKRVLIYLLPVLVSLSLLSLFRYQTTGSYRPTRSTFWHSFMVGVCQFSNPYGIAGTDTSVWRYARTVNKSLEKLDLNDMYKLPDSPYEETVRRESFDFIRGHPWLFARNIVYRIGIMISPLVYRDGDFIPQSWGRILAPLGILLFLLWFIGLFTLYRSHSRLFWLSLTIYLYFFAAFGWFYVVGRVILPFLFINCIVYLYGVERIVRYAAAKFGHLHDVPGER